MCTVPVYIELYLSFMKRWVVRVSNETVYVKGRCLSGTILNTVCTSFHFTRLWSQRIHVIFVVVS